jgi:UDP-2,3-diacylglucosamine hydrolase
MAGSKTYFASDFHLGVDARLSSLDREKKIVRWLSHISEDADALYLLGDIFDYWFEYGTVIPKGFTRILGKLAELRDGGLPIFFHTGNHDMWMFRYLEEEMGIPIYREPQRIEIHGKKLLIGHGDGLGPGDHGYKMIKKVFSNPFCQWAFARIHPNLGIRLMRYFSSKSRDSSNEEDTFHGPEKEWLAQYCEQKILTEDIDYFIFGHRHLPIRHTLSNNKSTYFNLGDWLNHDTYLVVDNDGPQLMYYTNQYSSVPWSAK